MSASLAQIERGLLGSGGPFEVCEEDVLGERLVVFKNRARSLRDLLERSRSFGDREYLVFGERRISFAEHLRLVASTAAALRERHGIGAGDRVALLGANSPEWAIAYFATVSLGAVAVALNGWWVEDEIRWALDDSEPKLLIADAKRRSRIGGRHRALPIVELESDFDALTRYAPDTPLPTTPIVEDERATLLYTSGTTGRPKGAVATHRNILALLGVSFFHGARLWAATGAAPPPAPALLSSNPMFHVSGLYTGIVAHLAAGAKSVWTVGRFDPEQTLELIERERITGWAPHGSMGWRVLRHPHLARYDRSSVRTLGSGGAPVPVDLQAALREAFPNAAVGMGVGYGLTEATALCSMCWGDDLLRHPTAVGRALPTVELQLRDGDGRTVSDGEEGEICVRGPTVMLEYWGNPAATAESIGPGRWLRTGDIGRVEDGVLYVSTRKRDLILRGAENVYPIEVEQVLLAHEDVEEVAVIGVDHAELGQEVKAVVVARSGRTLEVDALQRFVAARLAYFKVPAHWEVRTTPLPRNASGKVMKYLLGAGGENPYEEG